MFSILYTYVFVIFQTNLGNLKNWQLKMELNKQLVMIIKTFSVNFSSGFLLKVY